ncbi:hypothetical protein B0H13DRAFT_1968526 [Mycena leptocephala]|nr:hypothetical protein B0H13DRAFT_1968526 [Mycena leptocephala]
MRKMGSRTLGLPPVAVATTCNGDSIWTFHCRLHWGRRNSPGISLEKDTSVAFKVNKTRTILRAMLMLLDVISCKG